MSDTYSEHGTAALEAQPETETGALAVSANDFSALEERVLRAVDLVKQERQHRAAAEARAAQAEERAAQAEATLHEQAPVMEGMLAELKALKSERDHVRHRVERLLEQLDGLEL
jgi:hypothetical protein